MGAAGLVSETIRPECHRVVPSRPFPIGPSGVKWHSRAGKGCLSLERRLQTDGLHFMNPEKMTVMARQAVAEAQNEARRRAHNEVDTWHLLVALLAQEGGIVPSLVEKLGVTVSAMQLAANRELERFPKVSGSVDVSKIYVTQALNEVLTRAEAEAGALKDEFMSVEHLFLALIATGKPAALKKYFASFSLDRA